MNKTMLILIGGAIAGYFLADTITGLPVVGGVAKTIQNLGAKVG